MKFFRPYLVRTKAYHKTNASHAWGLIGIRKHLALALPILAQEIVEEDYLFTHVRLPFLPIAVYLGYLTLGMVPLAVSIAFTLAIWIVGGSLISRIPPIRRAMELRGQAVEAAWVEKLIRSGKWTAHTASDYWYAQARQLHSRYSAFSSLSMTETHRQLRQRREYAMAWVEDNAPAIIERYASRFPNAIY